MNRRITEMNRCIAAMLFLSGLKNYNSTMRYLLTISMLYSFFIVKGQTQADDILGTWWNPEKNSHIEVTKKDGKYQGKIVWLKEDKNEDGSSPRVDEHNEDESLRSRRILGLTLMYDLVWDEDDQEWDDGTIYDPRRGKTFSFYANLAEDGSMNIFAYVLGMPFLNKKLVCYPVIKE
ncbi:MAG: DUF2147 domain-containing protein [Schleiferiaceae bacterium]|jgi:uncharacterized protein (DUF2147 family)|nr:DUF2147 domain-containing protein [Schleiferiaceae bacterium]